MALKCTGLLLLFVFMFHGYLPVSVTLADESSITDKSPSMVKPPLIDYGTEYGDWKIKDMSKSQEITLPYNVSYFGSTYGKLYISPHGTIGFGTAARYIASIKFSEGLRNPSTDTPFIAPFYFDAYETHAIDPDTYRGSIYYRLINVDEIHSGLSHYSEHKNLLDYMSLYMREAVVNAPNNFNAKLVLVVTWDKVTDKENAEGNADCITEDDPDKCSEVSTFQAVLVTDGSKTYTIFNYLKMEIPLQASYQSGCNGGDGRGWFNVVPCLGVCKYRMNITTLEELPNLKGSDRQGRFILNVGGDVIVRGGCVPTELHAGMMEVFPRTVGMFGGEKLLVSGKCLSATAKIYCRFGTAAEKFVITEGAMINSMKGYCPAPLLTRIGQVDIYMSDDKADWTADNIITIVQPGRMGDPVTVQDPVKEQWFARKSSSINVPWDSDLFSDDDNAPISINLIGYREKDDSVKKEVEYKTLQTLGTSRNGQQQYTFQVADHRCKEDCEDFEMGLLEVALSNDYYGSAKDRVAVRYGPIPLGWYVNQALTDDRGSDWSDQKCREWHSADGENTKWLDDLLPCPCSLDQALADFGRWQPDPGCNLFTGSQCHYHIDAKHCVRSVMPTFKDGAGNQCCYNRDGTLRYSQLSYQGSTPDRSHAWGALPYDMADRVPEFSHWKHDVISFYYCCLWNDYDLCDLYMERRPTQDCRNYDVPAIAFVRGDPHFTTFDNQEYHFGGAGDFWLAQDDSIGYQLLIQGRFEPRKDSWDLGALNGKTSWKPTALTALAVRGGSDVDIRITLAPEHSVHQRGIDIQADTTRLYFDEKASLWQTFDGFSIVNNFLPPASNRHDNFTILLTRLNVGINVVAANGLLHVTVSVPPSMRSESDQPAKIKGLLGTYDLEKENDFTSKTNTVLSPGLDKEKIFENFALTWQVEPTEASMFVFRKKAEEADPDHAYYDFLDIPTNFNGAPPQTTVKHFCGGNERCEFDYQITGEQKIGQATKDADEVFKYIQSSAYVVDNCGLPEVGRMAIMSNYNFSVEQKTKVMGCGDGWALKAEAEYECVKETEDEARDNDRDDYGYKRTYPDDDNTYFIHWTPKPEILCTQEETFESAADVGLIVGVVVGVIAGIVLLSLVAFIIYKKRKSGKSNVEKPVPAKREKHNDPAAAEAMLARVEDRSPVYRPSKEPVRMSEIGSNV